MPNLKTRLKRAGDAAGHAHLCPPRLVLDCPEHVAEHEAWLASLSEADRARVIADGPHPYCFTSALPPES